MVLMRLRLNKDEIEDGRMMSIALNDSGHITICQTLVYVSFLHYLVYSS